MIQIHVLFYFQRTGNFGAVTPQHHQAQSLGLRPACHPDSGHAKHDVTKATAECLVDEHIEGQWPKGRLDKDYIVGQGRPVSQRPVNASSVVAAFLNDIILAVRRGPPCRPLCPLSSYFGALSTCVEST